MSFNMNQSFKMFSIKRWVSLGGFVVAVGLLLSGCGDRSRPADITVFRFSENGAPISMDPTQGATHNGARIRGLSRDLEGVGGML